MSKARERVRWFLGNYQDQSIMESGMDSWDLLEIVTGLELGAPSSVMCLPDELSVNQFEHQYFSFWFDRYPVKTIVEVTPKRQEIYVEKNNEDTTKTFHVHGKIDDESKLFIRSLLAEHSRGLG